MQMLGGQLGSLTARATCSVRQLFLQQNYKTTPHFPSVSVEMGYILRVNMESMQM